MNKLARKHRYEIFEQYVNPKLELKILEETNRYANQKITRSSFNIEDLETFNSLLLVTALSHEQEYFEKTKMI